MVMEELENLYPDHCPHGFESESKCPMCRRALDIKIDRNVISLGRKAPDTSIAAGARLLGRSGTKRRQIFDLIKSYPEGLCDHDIEALTGWSHQTASSTRNSLMNDGLVYDSGIRRKTPAGNDAIAWKAKE